MRIRKITCLLFAIMLWFSVTELHAQHADTVRTDTAVNFDEAKDLNAGATYLLSNVHFVIDRHKMKRESKDELGKLYRILNDNPKLKIQVEGHVCCIISALDALDLDNYEPHLSLSRAKAVYDYLVKKGIDASRLSYMGLGRSKPIIAKEKTWEDAHKNMRVEIRVIEN